MHILQVLKSVHEVGAITNAFLRDKTLPLFNSLFRYHQHGPSATKQTATVLTVQYESTVQQYSITGSVHGAGIELVVGI